MNRHRLALRILVMAAVALATSGASTIAAGDGQTKAFEAALSRAREQSSYRFTADAEQTLVPRAMAEAIGQSEERADVRLDGEVTDRDHARITLRVEGGGLDVPAVEMVQEGDKTYVMKDGQRLAVDSPYQLAAPTGDFLDYLDAGTGVHRLPETPSASVPRGIERYAFDVDGKRLAENARRMAQARLDQTGQVDGQPVPPGVAVTASPLLQAMTGSGELWIDGAGIPRRQVLDLDIPGVSAMYDARAHVVVDFDFGAGHAPTAAASPSRMTAAVASLGRVASGAAERCPLLMLLALGLAFCVTRPRRVYPFLVTAVCVSIVTTPILQAASIGVFQSRVAHAAPATSVTDVLGLPAGSAQAESRQAPAAADVQAMMSGGAGSGPACGDGTAGADTDGDGLADRTEYCLGTDPQSVDSDQDLITDTLEVDGISFGGRTWPGDPQKPDANGDGLPDYAEWPAPVGHAPARAGVDAWDPDGDGIPNLWDDDNDGDGVPDGLDASPFTRSAYDTSFSLVLDTGGFDGYAAIELQVQPQDMEHLRYSMSPLDWPYDDKGQLQDLDDSPGDLRLTPMLRFHTQTPPDREIARRYGVTYFADADQGGYTAYATLQPIGDGGQIVAFATQVVYGPEDADDIRWSDAELVWAAHMDLDQMGRGGRITTQTVPLHTYVEDHIRVSGLRVAKRGAYQVGLIGTPGTPNDDRELFNVLFGLSGTFLDNKEPGLRELARRFGSPNTPAEQTWGVPPTHVAMDLPSTAYGYLDEGLTDMTSRVPAFLDAQHYPAGSHPTVAIVTEEQAGVYSLDAASVLTTPAAIEVDLGTVAVATERTLKAATYGVTGGSWQMLATEDALGTVLARYDDAALDTSLASLHAHYPDLTRQDLKRVLLAYYTNWLAGLSTTLSVDGRVLVPAQRSDTQVYDQFHRAVAGLPEYIIEALALGQEGAGLRVGPPASTYSYLHDVGWPARGPAFSEALGSLVGMPEQGAGQGDLGLLAGTLFREVKVFFAVANAVKVFDSFEQVLRIEKSFSVFHFSSTVGKALGVLGLVTSVGITWLSYGLTTNWSDPIQAKQAIIQGVVATVLTAALFIISLTLLGVFVAAVFGVLDLLIYVLSFGMTSITAEIIHAFYHVDYLTYLADADFLHPRSGPTDPDAGLVAGYRFKVQADYRGLIGRYAEGDDSDLSGPLSYTYGRYDGSDTTEAKAVNQNAANHCGWEGDSWVCRNAVGVEYTLDRPGRDVTLKVLPKITASTYYEECTVGHCERKRSLSFMPEDAGHWGHSEVQVDVLPTTIGALWAWADIDNPDADGDTLSGDEETALGTDPAKWDTDKDGLSDDYEVATAASLGADPLKADTDGDGLVDGLEFRLGTRIDQADTDGDGLTDAQEVYHQDVTDADHDGDTTEWMGGWTAAVPERTGGAVVLSDPREADADGDGHQDAAERANATSPFAANAGPRLTLGSAGLEQGPGGDPALYAKAGDIVHVDLALLDAWTEAVSTRLSVCLPDFLSLAGGGTMAGDRQPPMGSPDGAVCSQGVGWSFAAPNSLQRDESAHTTLDLRVAQDLAASATGHVLAQLPYGTPSPDSEVRVTLRVVADAEAPRVAITAPGRDAVLGGGTTDYVVGGTSSDASSWVDGVDLVNLPDAGTVHASGTSPWAYTWHLPADGTYDLSASATDHLGHSASSATLHVTVDNTPPTVSLDLADGSYVTAPQGSDGASQTVTVTLNGGGLDNLSGIRRVQLSTDDHPWREVWADPHRGVGSVSWTADWTLPNETSSQGKHQVAVRAVDQAGNVSPTLTRTIIVDLVPPVDDLADKSYSAETPPYVPGGQPLSLRGVANDAGRVPELARPEDLVGSVKALEDAVIWLGLSPARENASGIHVAWLGDFNGDRLADLAMGLPGAGGGAGKVAIVLGRAGGWPLPPDAEALASSDTSFVGAEASSRLGNTMSAAGDVNGDGYADLLLGDAVHHRAYVVFGGPSALGTDLVLGGGRSGAWTELGAGAGESIGEWQAAAGDTNGDGYDDLLIGATGTSGALYVLLGQSTPWPDTIDVSERAALKIATSGTGARPAGVGDLDGDQNDEFAVADGQTVYVFAGDRTLGPGYGRPGSTRALSSAAATFASASVRPAVVPAGDTNGDGRDDFAFASGSSPHLVLGGDSLAHLTQHVFDNFTPPPSRFLAGVGDVDADGKSDLLLGNSFGDAFLVLGKDLDKVQATLTDVDSAAQAPYAAGADLNSDGSSDLLVVPARSSGTGGTLGGPDYGGLPYVDQERLPVTTASSGTSPAGAAAAGALAGKAAEGRTAAAAGSGSSPQQAALTRYVNDDPGCDGESPCYQTIQDAADASMSGDTIVVQPGLYPAFTIGTPQLPSRNRDNLTVRGEHPDAVFVEGGGWAYAVRIEGARGIRLENLTLRNATVGVLLKNAGFGGYDNPSLGTVIDHVLVYDVKDHAVSMDRASTVDVVRSTLAGGGTAVGVYGDPDPELVAGWSTVVSGDQRAGTDAWGGAAAAGGKVDVMHGWGAASIDRYDPSAGAWSTALVEPAGPSYGLATAGDSAGTLWALRGDPWGDFDGTVYAVAYVSASEIYAGGDFHSAGGTSVDYVARWDGSRWTAAGSPANRPNGPVHVLEYHGGGPIPGLYAGGDFGLRRLQGGSWFNLGNTDGSGSVYAIGVDDTYGVYIGGSFNRITEGGVTRRPVRIARRDLNGTWHVLGGRTDQAPSDSCNGVGAYSDDVLRHIEIHGDRAVFVGRFMGVNAGCGAVYSFEDVAAVDMSSDHFVSVASAEVDRRGTVEDLAYVGDDMVLAGDFTCVGQSCDVPAQRLAIRHGSDWVLPDFLKANGRVRSVQVDGNVLVVGGDFTTVGNGVAAAGLAAYTGFPNDGGTWSALDGGFDAAVHAAVRAGGNVYAGGSFTRAAGHPSFGFARWNGAAWTGQSFQVYSGSWQRAADLPAFARAGAALTSDGAGHVYALVGGGTTAAYRYTQGSNSWASVHALPAGAGTGAALAWASSALYALRGGGTADLCRYAPDSNVWACDLAEAPWPLGAGGSLVSDGGDYLYALAGGNGAGFARYHVPTGEWQVLQSAPAQVGPGGGLARVGRYLYGVAGGADDLWRYGPVGVYPRKLQLDHTAIVVPEETAAGTWLAVDGVDPLRMTRQPDDFGVAESFSAWVGGHDTTWSPDPAPLWPGPGLGGITTHDVVRFLDPDRDVYRLTADSELDAGYTAYVPDVTHATSGSGYESIQAAIDSGTNRVMLQPGVYRETFHLLSGVEVVGSGADQTVIAPPEGTAPRELVTAEGVVGGGLALVTLDGGTPGGGQTDGFLAEDGARALVLSRNLVRGAQAAIRIKGAYTDIEVVNQTIVDNTDGLRASLCAPVDVRNTVFSRQSGTGLAYDAKSSGCGTRRLHTYNVYWDNGVDQSPAEPGAAELFLDPLFLDPAAHDYRTADVSPVVDAGDPRDPTPPGTGQRTDIGYIEQGRASYYADDDYCSTCANDGLEWQVDAYDRIQDALDKAASDIAAVCHAADCPSRAVGVAPGTYAEALSVPGHVRLIGTDPAKVQVDASGYANGLTISGVADAEVTGLTFMKATGANIAISGAAHDIIVQRNIVRDASGYGIVVSGSATANLLHNTIVFNALGGVLAQGAGSWAWVQNNDLYNNNEGNYGQGTCNDGWELRTSSAGQLFNDYNLLSSGDCFNREYNYSGNTDFHASIGQHDLMTQPGFVDLDQRDLRLRNYAAEIDKADPLSPVPAGGGDRADIGYWEYREPVAAQATVLLGREDVSTATGNSGSHTVEVGVVPVADPTEPVTATLPSLWTAVTLDNPDTAVARWMATYTPAAAGLHRIYSRASDAVGNVETEAEDWYEGAFIVDPTPPQVALLAPTAGTPPNTKASPLELRAQAADYAGGDFTVAEVRFVLDGQSVEASWAAEPWDPSTGAARVFRAWVTPAAGAHTVKAVARDQAGNEAATGTVSFSVAVVGPADSAPPTLVVASPLSGQVLTGDVTFSGTVADLGSGAASVEVSLDGGVTWLPATITGTAWSLCWTMSGPQDYVTRIAQVRAQDRAGNGATQTRPFVVDNVAPHRVTPVTFSVSGVAAPEGEHFDLPVPLTIAWQSPLDGSGVALVKLAVDQHEITEPTIVVPGTTATYPLNADGDWYVHLSVIDAAGNSFTRHYGPWHIGFFAYLARSFEQRTQTIKVDGVLDLPNYEWLETERLDDDERPVRDGPRKETQALYGTWEGTAFYLGWQGAWWDADGKMWAFFDTGSGGENAPSIMRDYYGSAEVWSAYTLPFLADMVVMVDGRESGQLWTWTGSAWQTGTATFAHGEDGGTEVRVPLPLASIPAVRMAAMAIDDGGRMWSVFPTSNWQTSNPHRLSRSFSWEDIAEQFNPWANQPRGASVYVKILGLTDILSKGPNTDIDLLALLDNFEGYAVPGLQLAITATQGIGLQAIQGANCVDCGGDSHWLLDIGSMLTGATQPITITARTGADLGGLSTIGLDVGLLWNGIGITSTNMTYAVDNLPPTLTVDDIVGAVRSGPYVLYGEADDGDGGGVQTVEVSLDQGATWQTATGTVAWSAPIDIPGDVTSLEVWVRAGDVFGQFSLQTVGLTVIPNQSPVADAGPDLTVAADDASGADVTLDASATVDPEGDQLAYKWREGTGKWAPVIADWSADPTATVHLSVGRHIVELVAKDDHDGESTDTVIVTVTDVTGHVSISGRVTQGSEEGTPFASVVVTAASDDGSLTEQAVSDENGFYTFEDLPAGAYTLTAHKLYASFEPGGQEAAPSVAVPPTQYGVNFWCVSRLMGQPTVKVELPDGNQTWLVGEQRTIAWTTALVQAPLEIELSRDGGATYETLFSGVADDGQEAWVVTGPPTAQARVRVSGADSEGQVVSDTSDSDFAIHSSVPPTVSTGGPYEVPEGGAATLAATGTDSGGGALAYAWDLDGDGTFETPGQTVEFSAAEIDGPASRTVSVRGANAAGDAGTDQTTITIANAAPTATLGAPEEVNEGDAIELTLGGASDPSSADTDAGLHYAFDCGSGYGELSTANAASCPTTDSGQLVVKGKVVDKDGGQSEYTDEVAVRNVAPSATFNVYPAQQGADVELSLTDPTDPSSADTAAGFQYAFDCGDGTGYGAFGQAANRSCQTVAAGSRVVKGQIRDKDGASSDYSAAVSVSNVAPLVDTPELAPSPSEEGAEAAASATFYDQVSDTPFSCTVDYGDGSGAQPGTVDGLSCSGPAHVYADSGAYEVTVTVSDGLGATGSAATTHMVSNVAPTGTFTAPAVVNEGDVIALSLTGVVDPGTVDTSEGFLYAFSCDGTYGAYQATGTATCATDDNGPRTVKGKVADRDGGETEYAALVAVSNVAPSATFHVGSVEQGADIELSLVDPTDPSSADTAAGFAYAFDCGDGAGYGTFSPAASRSCPTSAAESRTVRATIRDKDGASSEYTANVSVSNVAPMVDTPGVTPEPSMEGGLVVAGATFADQAGDAPFACAVDYGDGSGAAAGAVDGMTCTGPSHLYTDDGEFVVSVTVTDRHGTDGVASTNHVVHNVAPTAEFSAPTEVDEGSSIELSLSEVSDPGSDDAAAGFKYAFDCGGGYGSYASSSSSSCPTTDNGLRAVKGKVKDQDGAETEYASEVIVRNVAPTAAFDAPTAVDEGDDVVLSLTAPWDPSSADTEAGFDYAFSCGDGYGDYSADHTASCPTTDNGDITVMAKIRDKDGAETEYGAAVEVRNVAPTATFSLPEEVDEGDLIVLSMTEVVDAGSDDLAGITYAFDCGGDANGYGDFSSSHNASCPTDDGGTRTVKGMVRDKDGGVTEYTATVTIQNVAPSASFGAPDAVDEGSSIQLSLTNAFDPSSADTAVGFQYAFDCGDRSGGSSGANTASCTTSDNGTRTVKGKVVDKDGGQREYTADVTVNSVAPIAVFKVSGTASQGSTIELSLTDPADPSSADTEAGFHYAFDCGDGSGYADVGGASTRSCTTDSSGDRTVGGRISDKDGAASTYTVGVSVDDVAPQVDTPTLDPEPSDEGAATVASATFVDQSVDAPFTCTVDYGDGSEPQDGTADETTCTGPGHTYADDGTYTVVVTVTDKSGAVGSASASHTAFNVAPTAPVLGGGPVNEGSTTSLTFGDPFDPSTADVAAGFHYAFDFDNDGAFDVGDGTYAGSGSEASADVPAAYLADGPASRTVTARIIDKDGGHTDYQIAVTVDNVPPTAVLEAPSSVPAGVLMTVALTGAGDPSSADVAAGFQYAFDCGDGSGYGAFGTASTAVCATFSDPGTLTVRGAVRDKDGGEREYAASVDVNEANPCDMTPTIHGSSKSETINGTPGDDIIFGGGGNDHINGNGGNDVICTGSGNDKITTLGGNDLIDAGGGNNEVSAGDGINVVMVGNGSDRIDVGSGSSAIFGGGGNNTIDAAGGNNAVTTGSGNDKITTGNGNDVIQDSGGSNDISVGAGVNKVTTGNGDDKIVSATCLADVDAGGGNNRLSLGDGACVVTTGSGNDTISRGNGSGAVNAGGGNNTIAIGTGVHPITCGNGNDNVTDGDTGNVIDVGGGNNTVRAGGGDDSIFCGNGNDFVDGGPGVDHCEAGGGNNTIVNCE